MKNLIVTCLFVVGFVMLTVWLKPFHLAPKSVPNDSSSTEDARVPPAVYEHMEWQKEHALKKSQPIETTDPTNVWTEEALKLVRSLWPASTVTREGGDWLLVDRPDKEPLWLLPLHEGTREIPLLVIGCDKDSPMLGLLDGIDEIGHRVKIQSAILWHGVQTQEWMIDKSGFALPPNQVVITRDVLEDGYVVFSEGHLWTATFDTRGLKYDLVQQICLNGIN
jgi:hypothetical protein